MTQPVLLSITAAVLVVTMLIHSILGQRRLIRPLLDQDAGIMQRPLARFLVPFAWHFTSLLGLIVAAILLAWAWAPEHALTIGLASTGTIFTLIGIFDAIASRGEHVGWPFLTAIGLLSFGALAIS